MKERRNVYGFARNNVRRVSHNVYAEADCGLYGQIDTLVTLANGNVVPVEVKYSNRVTIFQQWKKQITAYAFLLRSLGHRVTYGIIYFPRQKTTVNIPVYSDDLDQIPKDVAKVKSLLEGEKMPRGVREEKCAYCEVRKFCVK